MKYKFVILRIFLITGSYLLFYSCYNQPNAKEIIEKVNNNTENIKGISYDIDFQMKFFMRDDTSKIKAKVWLLEFPEDTVYGYKVRIDQADGKRIIYNGNELYLLEADKELRYDLNPLEYIGILSGNISGRLAHKPLLEGFNYEELEAKSDSIYPEPSEFKNNLKFKIIYPDREDYSDQYKYVWVEKDTYLPVKSSYHAVWEGGHQYDFYDISNIVINPEDINLKFYLTREEEAFEEEDPFKDYVEPDPQVLKGHPAPDFTLPNLKGDSITLSEVEDKLILIDFWYMSCKPCVVAMPYLQKLQNEFDEKGLEVFGLNSFDNIDKRREKLASFLERKGIFYQNLLSTQEVAVDYSVPIYPTLYLINSKKEIVFVKEGFNPSEFEDLRFKVDSLLKL